MNGIAEVLINLGYHVSGSDLKENAAVEHLRSIGAEIFIGHDASNVGDAGVVVTSTAVHADNPEVVEAKNRNIPVVPRAIMLAELMRLRQGIAVAGTHGKTTTTSLITSILERGGLDPTFVIGGRLNAAGSNAKLGQGLYIVAEADEAAASLQKLSPVISVVTNIDEDHMDTYGHDLRNLRKAFTDFIQRLPFYGRAVMCIESENVRAILPKITKPILTYGFREDAQIRAENIRADGTQMHFTLIREGASPEEITVNLPGVHNVLNSLAAIGVALTLDVPMEAIKEALSTFKGVGRRFSVWGETKSLKGEKFLVVDDYGHHPTEMAATIAAARGAYPDRRLLVAFQPHRYTRTRDLYDDFANVLTQVDALLMLDVYPAGEAPIPGADSRSLCRTIRGRGKVDPILVSDPAQAAEMLASVLTGNDLVLVQGAGNIGKIARHLAEIKLAPQKTEEERHG